MSDFLVGYVDLDLRHTSDVNKSTVVQSNDFSIEQSAVSDDTVTFIAITSVKNPFNDEEIEVRISGSCTKSNILNIDSITPIWDDENYDVQVINPQLSARFPSEENIDLYE